MEKASWLPRLATFLPGLLLCLLLTSCGAERYPLKILSGKTYLVSRDRTGQEVWLLVDTGSDSSFVSRAWAARVGARIEDGPPAVWAGWNLWDEGSHRVVGLSLPGVPDVLNGLAAMDDPRRSPLDDPGPIVGLVGTDVLWAWTLDFRGDTPWLVHGPVEENRLDTDRIRYDLKVSAGHYTLPMQWYAGADLERPVQVTWGNELIVDTGCPWVLAGFVPEALKAPGVVNSRLPWSANGFTTEILHADGFRLGTFLIPPFHAVVGVTGGGGSLFFAGTPGLQALRAVVNLGQRTFSFSRQLRPLEVTAGSPEAWAWSATKVEGEGVVLGQVLPGSTVERRGVKTMDTVAAVDGFRLDRPLSVLETKRSWTAFALGGER